MKTISKEYRTDIKLPKIIEKYLPSERFCVFDIETLGLNPSKQEMILAGFLEPWGDQRMKLTQYFCEHPKEEKEVLQKTIAHLNTFDYVITYNGRHFDLPYVSKRAEVNGLKDVKPNLCNLDIYLVINGCSQFKKLLPNLKQKTVEIYAGIAEKRDDEISGKDSIDFYYNYVSCSDLVEKEEMRRQILLHNHDDILQLYKLTALLKKCDIHKAFYRLGFFVPPFEDITRGISWKSFTIDAIKQGSREISIEGRYGGKPISYFGYDTSDHPYRCEFTEDHRYRLNVGVESVKNNAYVDLSVIFKETSSYLELLNLPGYVDGYLILKENGELKPMELSMLAKSMVEAMMKDTVI